MKKIVILGASGSIGQSTLEVIQNHSEQFELVGFSVYNQIEKIPVIIETFSSIEMVAVKDILSIQSYILAYPHIKFVEGEEGIKQLVSLQCDVVLNAIVGFAGLIPTIQAIKNKKDIALANKETLVAGGKLVMELVKQNKVNLYPVDSEHSAIFQCLEDNKVHKVILTASGGPFYLKSLSEVENVTVEQALNHPNWKMGAKITIDSATMFNKAFEIIEAKWLFNLEPSQIDVIIHPQSIIHSMIEYDDGSIKAQLGNPDMKIPISYALTYPKRLSKISTFLSLDSLKKLTFHSLNKERFEAVSLAYEALKKQGTFATVMNAANEVAVDLYLQHKISFGAITRVVKKTLKAHDNQQDVTLENIIKADQWARDYARRLIKNDICI